MLGSQNGTAKLLKDVVETHLIIIHAVAHVEQVSNLEHWCSIAPSD